VPPREVVGEGLVALPRWSRLPHPWGWEAPLSRLPRVHYPAINVCVTSIRLPALAGRVNCVYKVVALREQPVG